MHMWCLSGLRVIFENCRGSDSLMVHVYQMYTKTKTPLLLSTHCHEVIVSLCNGFFFPGRIWFVFINFMKEPVAATLELDLGLKAFH